MKHTSFFIALITLALPAVSCSLVNAVRYKVSPPNISGNSNLNTNQSPTTVLNVQDTKNLKAKADELAKISPPLKLDPKAKAKGKILMITKSESGRVEVQGFNYPGDDYLQAGLDLYGLKKEELATKVEDIKTIILKTCDKGGKIGQYSLSDGRTIPAFAIECKVSVIDYQIPAVIAEKKFSNRDLYTKIMATSKDTEYINSEPEGITDYIKKIPRE